MAVVVVYEAADRLRSGPNRSFHIIHNPLLLKRDRPPSDLRPTNSAIGLVSSPPVFELRHPKVLQAVSTTSHLKRIGANVKMRILWLRSEAAFLQIVAFFCLSFAIAQAGECISVTRSLFRAVVPRTFLHQGTANIMGLASHVNY